MTAPESRAADLVKRLRNFYGAGREGLRDYMTGDEAILHEAADALTTSAAAEAAMRETLTEVHRCDMNYNVFDCPTGGYMRKKIDAALATPASAQAERMMRITKAAEAIRDDESVAPHLRLIMRQALRALGETGET